MANVKNLRELPNNGFAPSNQAIAKHLREQAQCIEESEVNIRNVFLVVEHEDGTLYRQTTGHPCDLARAIGMMTIACTRASMGAE